MRTVMMWMLVALAGCELASDKTAVQEVAGPGGVVVAATPVAGELAVTWSPDPAGPFKYYVFQSTSGADGPFTFVKSILDQSASPPAPTSYTAQGLAGGVEYCYAIESAYTDGSTSELGAAGCGAAQGAAPTRSRRFYPTVIANDGTWSQTDGFGVPGLVASGVSTTGLYLALPYDEGDRITGLSIDVKGTGSGVVSFSVTSELYNTPITSSSVLSLLEDSNRPGGSWSVAVMPSFTPKVLTGHRFLYLGVTHSAGGYAIGTVEMFFDRPSP